MFGGQLGVVCTPVVLIGLSVLSKIMMKAFFCVAAGDDGDGDEGTDLAKRHRNSNPGGIARGTYAYMSLDHWARCCPEQ